jgi:hypothetical protein
MSFNKKSRVTVYVDYNDGQGLQYVAVFGTTMQRAITIYDPFNPNYDGD